MSDYRVDVRGRSCPEPVLMTVEAIKKNPETFEILADNLVAVENIQRCCTNKGYTLEVVEDGDTYTLTAKRK